MKRYITRKKYVTIRATGEFSRSDLAWYLMSALMVDDVDGFIETIDMMSAMKIQGAVREEFAYRGCKETSFLFEDVLPADEVERAYDAAVIAVTRAWPELEEKGY